jgi:WD40 repeat protein
MAVNPDMFERAPATLLTTVCPVPHTTRGFNFNLGACAEVKAHQRGDMLVYPNGRFVFLREFGDFHNKVRVFGEHKATVNVAKASPNGRHVASGDAHGQVLIWEIRKNDFSLRNTFPINTSVKDISWSPDNKRIVVAGASNGDSFVIPLLVDSGNTVGTCPGNLGTVLSVDYKPTRPFRIISGGEDRLVCFFDGPPFKFGHTCRDHTNYVTSVRFSPDGSQFFSTGNDSKIYLYDGKTGEKTGEFKGSPKKSRHAGTIASACWSPDGKQLLTAGADKTCKVWNMEDKSLVANIPMATIDVKRPELEAMQVSCLWFKDKTVSVSLSGAINFLDVKEQSFTSIHGVQTAIACLEIDRKNRLAYTGEVTGVITKIDLTTSIATWFHGKHSGSGVNCLRLTGNDTIEVFNKDDKVRSHPVTGQRNDEKTGPQQALGGAAKDVATSILDPNLSAVVLAQDKLLIMKDGNITCTVPLTFSPLSVAFAADDSKVYVGGKNRGIATFSLDTASYTATADAGPEMSANDVVTKVRTSADGKYVVAIDKKRSLMVYDLQNGGANLNGAQYLRFHNMTVNDGCFSPDGSKFATVGNDSMAIVYYDGLMSTHRLGIRDAHMDTATFCAFLDETTLVTAGTDRLVRVWTIPATYSE